MPVLKRTTVSRLSNPIPENITGDEAFAPSPFQKGNNPIRKGMNACGPKSEREPGPEEICRAVGSLVGPVETFDHLFEWTVLG